MASAAGPFPIFYTPDVHNFYIKQKHEFHFNQKSDNEFLMFLLDTAVRVISIVQHLAPVIEAVSDASLDMDDMDDISPDIPALIPSAVSGAMEVEALSLPTPLSAELEQINQEITNAQISSLQKCTISFPTTTTTSLPSYQTTPQPEQPMESVSLTLTAPTLTGPSLQPTMISAQSTLLQSEPPSQSTAIIVPPVTANMNDLTSKPPINNPQNSNINILFPESAAQVEYPPNVPVLLLPTSAEASQDVPTSIPSVRQPVAEAASLSIDVKTEQAIAELIDIKEEIEDSSNEGSSNFYLGNLQNFVPTATPSSLPPSFLDRGSNNPLSMVGSMNTGDGPGPSGLNIPGISESMMKNIAEAGLNAASIKGHANSNLQDFPDYCNKKKKFTYRRKRYHGYVTLAHRLIIVKAFQPYPIFWKKNRTTPPHKAGEISENQNRTERKLAQSNLLSELIKKEKQAFADNEIPKLVYTPLIESLERKPWLAYDKIKGRFERIANGIGKMMANEEVKISGYGNVEDWKGDWEWLQEATTSDRSTSGETQKVCSICGKDFANAQNLRNHVRYVHHKERTNACQFCGKAFGASSGKLRHEGYFCKYRGQANS